MLKNVYRVSSKGKSSLLTKSFINGDGFMYVYDGATKVKKPYSGITPAKMIENLLDRFVNYLPHFINSSNEEMNKFVEYDISLDFHFNTFKLYRDIDYVCIDNGVKTKLNFVVDSKDRINKITIGKEHIQFVYGSQKLSLPSTAGYELE